MKKKLFIIIGIVLLLLIFLGVGMFFYLGSAPSKDKTEVSIVVKPGESYGGLSEELLDNSLIRSELIYKIYLKLLNPTGLEAGKYTLRTNMSVTEIIKVLSSTAGETRETIKITFVEGKNMRYLVTKLSEGMSISEEDIYAKLTDEEYLDVLINKHWIITEEIKNKDIYYSLEGYLYPDTYQFYKDASIEDIFEKMINNLEDKLDIYKAEIEESGYTFHQILTLASIIEQEAGNSDDRKGVAGVFYNRLSENWSLGSDVTTYYAEKLELWSRDLYKDEINECNSYNTRATCMRGKLPVSPICNPGINSVIAAIEPASHNYYYFVADKNGKTYFNETNKQHSATVSKLKNEGLWYEYD